MEKKSDNDDITQLEQEFEALVNSVGEVIAKKVEQATKLLDEACKLADDNGIPFESGISHLGQAYVPTSFQDKYSTLDEDRVEELTGVASYSLGNAYGWEHSDVC